jgi:quercetin dioxygenase-like cupin family protein
MPDHVIDNPTSGERIIVRQTARQTGGALLAFDLILPPGGHVPAWHAHPIQEERFTVTRGQLRFRLRHRTLLARPGQIVHVPPRTAHWFDNPGPEPAEAHVELRPALRTQEFFERAAALRRPGLDWHWLRTLARLLLEFSGEVAVPLVPASLMGALLRAAAGRPPA